MTELNPTSSARMNTHHMVKVLALVIMTIDHLGAYLFPDYLWFRSIGRMGMPIWFFMIGFAPPRPVKHHIWLWAGILALTNPFLGGGILPLNALVTLVTSQYLVRYVEKRDLIMREPAVLVLAALIFLLPSFVLMEYGSQGYLFALMGYCVRSGLIRQWQGKLVAASAWILFLTVQAFSFDFTVVQLIAMLVGTTAITFYLARFTFRPMPTVPEKLARFGAWWSRHSMQYYVIHRIIFQAIGTYYLGILDASLHVL